MTGGRTVHLPGQVVAVSVLGGEADSASEATPEARNGDLRQAIGALNSAAQQLDEARGQLLREAEEQLIDLAIDIARKILMQEIEAGRAQIDPIVAEALKRVPPRQQVIVHLNPEDHAQCEMAEQSEDSGAANNVRFVADPSVPRAGCVVETSEGVVDSSVQEHLAEIASALKNPE